MTVLPLFLPNRSSNRRVQSRAVVRLMQPAMYLAQAMRIVSRYLVAVVNSHSSIEVAALRCWWGSFWNLLEQIESASMSGRRSDVRSRYDRASASARAASTSSTAAIKRPKHSLTVKPSAQVLWSRQLPR